MRITVSHAGLFAVAVLLSACMSDSTTTPPVDRVAAGAAPALSLTPGTSISVVSAEHFPLLPNNVLATINNATTLNKPVSVFNGGFGSAVDAPFDWLGPIYSLTDRGPNVAIGNDKLFAVPDFHPQVGLFFFFGQSLFRAAVITLKDAHGNPKTGIPIGASGCGATGEIPLDINGNTLPFDPNGIDSEGLRVMLDGSFWVSDEYGPFLTHFDRNGVTIEQNSPCAGPNQLPAVLIHRQPNKGMEGLASIQGGQILVGMIQDPLDNPTGAAKKSNLLRIIYVDTKKHTTKTFLYAMDDPSYGVSEIEAVSNTQFLVDERDGKFFGDPAGASKQKKIYLIDISNATDVSDPTNSQSGLVIGGKTIEQMTAADLTANHIQTVPKTLVVDLLQWGYPHDKAEGVVLLDAGMTIGVTNDDDFGVSDDGNGHLIQKIVPSTGLIDHNELWLFHLNRNLHLIH
jgi:hypothetical protein